jgi:hypothetical protein
MRRLLELLLVAAVVWDALERRGVDREVGK